jgi:hypothetical protein
MQDHAYQQGLRGLLPMGFEPAPVRIDNQGREIQDIANFIFRREPDFRQWIPVRAAMGLSRFRLTACVHW